MKNKLKVILSLALAMFCLASCTNSEITNPDTDSTSAESVVQEFDLESSVRSIGCDNDITESGKADIENGQSSVIDLYASDTDYDADSIVLCLSSVNDSSEVTGGYNATNWGESVFWKFETEEEAEHAFNSNCSDSETINDMDVSQSGNEFYGVQTWIRSENMLFYSWFHTMSEGQGAEAVINYFENLNTLGIPILIDHTINPEFNDNMVTVTLSLDGDFTFAELRKEDAVDASCDDNNGIPYLGIFDFTNAEIFTFSDIDNCSVSEKKVTVRYDQTLNNNGEPIHVTEAYVI